MIRKITDKFRLNMKPRVSNPDFVGRIVYSPYIGSNLLVTRYYADDDWYFVRIVGDNPKDQYGKQMKAGTVFSYFIENGLER